MKKWHFISISVLICIFDQLTKYLVLENMEPYSAVTVMPFFDLVLVFNTGSAFSFLSSAGSWHLWFFLVFTSIMSVVLLVWMLRAPLEGVKQLTGLAFILGGALGNLVDRVWHGHVIDFIDLYYKNHHWPAFNVADAAICFGVIILAASWSQGDYVTNN